MGKQELMDSSVLLDNINEVLSIWDSQQSNTQSLQPSYLFSPSFTSTNNNNNANNKSNKSNHHRPHSSRRPISKSLKKSKSSKKSHHRSLPPNKSADFHQKTAVTVAGPHQTYYIKDDTSIRHKNNHKNHGHHKSKTHHRHRKHHHNVSRTPINITSIDEIPSFCVHNDRRLNLLAEMIELKRNELERISGRHDGTLDSIIDLYLSATASVIHLRKQHRFLSSFAEQLSREGQIRNKLSDSILSTLHNIEEQRKNLLNKIESPSWEIKHHFHILSFEHFRGNQQPHLLEIAEVLPSRLQIAAISHSSTLKNDALLKQFNIAQKERDLLYKKLSQIDKKRQLVQSHLKDYKKMMQIIKKNIGEKRLNKLKAAKESKMRSKPKQNKKHIEFEQMMQSMASPVASPSFGPMNGRFVGSDRFRLQYLSAINIRKSNEQNEVMEVKKKTKYKRRLLKSKPLRQNILNIIDKQKFVLHGVQSQKENDKKMIYSVSLRNDENQIEMKEDANEYEVDLSDNIHGNHFEAKQVVQNEENKNTMDAPHRDWSVLAKHLKDSSKEQARRKQISKQLERILHVREGLIVGFDQLKQIYQSSKIGQTK